MPLNNKQKICGDAVGGSYWIYPEKNFIEEL